jgi:hypothetical protein
MLYNYGKKGAGTLAGEANNFEVAAMWPGMIVLPAVKHYSQNKKKINQSPILGPASRKSLRSGFEFLFFILYLSILLHLHKSAIYIKNRHIRMAE